MERKEATALLKEIVANSLLIPSLVALKESRRGKFDLILKGDCDSVALTQFVTEKNLMAREDSEKGYWLISGP